MPRKTNKNSDNAGENIRVVCRFRPVDSREKRYDQRVAQGLEKKPINRELVYDEKEHTVFLDPVSPLHGV